jgi:hypothetical protein
MDLKTLDRLESVLRENREKTAAKGGTRIYLPVGQRLREFDQMIELVRELKAAIYP